MMELSKEFSSYVDFAAVLKQYEHDTFCNYTTMDSTTVERARKKQAKRVFR